MTALWFGDQILESIKHSSDRSRHSVRTEWQVLSDGSTPCCPVHVEEKWKRRAHDTVQLIQISISHLPFLLSEVSPSSQCVKGHSGILYRLCEQHQYMAGMVSEWSLKTNTCWEHCFQSSLLHMKVQPWVCTQYRDEKTCACRNKLNTDSKMCRSFCY